LLVFCAFFSFGQNNISGPIVKTPVYFDVSPPLRDMVKKAPKKADNSWKDGIVQNRYKVKPPANGQEPGGFADPGLQRLNSKFITDTTIVNFDGTGNNEGYVPPDTHGDVGPNHYFQVVNCHFSIYSKTGSLIMGNVLNSTIWNGMANNYNDGDAVVLYDEQADRWLFAQFSLGSMGNGPYYENIAISQTGDPTGSWYRCQYQFTQMPDYPKFGVWPDGYYMSAHLFTSTFYGCAAVVFDRTKMLAGNTGATMQMFTTSSSNEAYGWLPSDCDGPFPTGNPPNYFIYPYYGSPDNLGIWELHVDWTTLANSTLSNFTTLTMNACTDDINGVAPTLTVLPPTRDVTAPAGSTDFTVTSNSFWTVTSDQTWCTPTPSGTGNGTLVADYQKNPSTAIRTANITVTVSGITPVAVTVVQDGVVGIAGHQDGTIRIIPNPSTGLFRIVPGISGNIRQIDILDLTGRIILSRICTNENDYQFDLSNASQGCYFVKVILNDETLVRRLVISR